MEDRIPEPDLIINGKRYTCLSAGPLVNTYARIDANYTLSPFVEPCNVTTGNESTNDESTGIESASIVSAPTLTENAIIPDARALSQVFAYLQVCDSEYRKNVDNTSRSLAEKDIEISKLTQSIAELKSELTRTQVHLFEELEEYDVIAKRAIDTEAKYTALIAEHATLKRHFDTIANGFANMITDRSSGKVNIHLKDYYYMLRRK